MNKLAEHYYQLGVQLALNNTGMEKNAFISMKALRSALSKGSRQSAEIYKALGERHLGQMGTMHGAAGGALLASKVQHLDPSLQLLLAGTGAVGGGALGNILGRNVGRGVAGVEGYISGLAPFRATGNFLADPLRRVPGIRG
jgi:hypothetical protein